ncbi:MAG: hypothetical protein HKM07_01160 [Chlamydiae bacterium]|nr:hypothetical protein [Chlamydiota bacterium]
MRVGVSNSNASYEVATLNPSFWHSSDDFDKILVSLEVVSKIFKEQHFGLKLDREIFIYSILNAKGMNKEQLQRIFDKKKKIILPGIQTCYPFVALLRK